MEDTSFILELINDIYNWQKEDTINLSKIEKVRQFIFEKLISLIDRSNLYEDEYTIFEEIKNNFNQWVNIEKKPWLKDDKTIIVFMGKFSSGKSSIINSILGENFLPVDITPTTAIPTYISYAPEISVKVVDNDNNIKKFDIEKFRKISKEIMRDFPLSYIVKHFVIGYDNNALKGKSLLDTPGFGDSCDEHDRNNILEVIKESDVIFWVVDIQDGTISNDSLKVLQVNLDKKPLYIVLNKADSKIESEQKQIMENVEETLKSEGKKYEKILLYSNKNGAYANELQKIIEKITLKEKNNPIEKIKEQINKFIEKLSQTIQDINEQLQQVEKEEDSKKGEKDNLQLYIKTTYNRLNNIMDASNRTLWESIRFMEEEEYKLIKGTIKAMVDSLDTFETLTSSLTQYSLCHIDLDRRKDNLQFLRNKAHKIKEEFQIIMEEI